MEPLQLSRAIPVPAMPSDRAPTENELAEPLLASGTAQRVIVDGVIAGMIGYLTVVALLAAVSMARGQSPFMIATLLGSRLFDGAADATIQANYVIAYNGVHLVVLLLTGLVMAAFSALAERAPQAWYLGAILFPFAAAHVVGLPLWFDAQVRAVLPLWLVVIVTTAAVLPMALYLWYAYPGIRREMHEPDE
jgi:hypothetical protein